MHKQRHFLVSSIVISCFLVACGDDVEIIEIAQGIVNGTIDSGHEAVVQVAPVTGFEPCTGTLIGSATVLTAAHCVHDGWTLRPQMQARVPVRACTKCSVTYAWHTGTPIAHPNYQAAQSTGVDLALILLNNPTPFAERAKIPGLAKILVQIVGGQITMVGFGQPDVNTQQFDVKRWGTNFIDSADNTYFYFSGVQGSDAITCSGDSGGPAFAGPYTSSCILGITRGESGIDDLTQACQGIGLPYHTRLDRTEVASWILSNADATVSTCIPYM